MLSFAWEDSKTWFRIKNKKITHRPKGLPVESYLSLQGRYGHLKNEEIQAIQGEVNQDWQRLHTRAEEMEDGLATS